MDDRVNFDLNVIFKAHYTYCINWLMNYLKCPKQDAEDCFMDALVKLKMLMMEGKFKSVNTQAWLCTVAKNAYLNQRKSKNKTAFLDIEKVEAYIGQQKGIYNLEFNPLLKNEALNELTLQEKQRIDAYKKAFEALSEACKKILNKLKTGAKLKDLTNELGYANYDSLKSTKARCMKNLKLNAQKLLEI